MLNSALSSIMKIPSYDGDAEYVQIHFIARRSIEMCVA